MLIIVTYDVSTETAAGRRRLRRVAKDLRKRWPTRAEIGV